MKQSLTILFILLQLIATAGKLHVGKNQHYKTIRTAIEYCKDGDTIFIHPGVYAEGEMLITKTVHLSGIDKPVLDGRGRSQILNVQANGVVIEGLVIRNAGYSSLYDWAAIRVINSLHVVIKNNELLNNAFGIYFQNSGESEIANNFIKGNTVDEVSSGNAIHCWKSHHLKIRNNTVTGHRDGLYFEFVTNSFIQGNNSYKNLRYGIHFMFSHDDTYVANTFRSNGAGVAVMFSRGVTMRLNKFQDNWGSGAYGMLLKEITNGTIEHNIFSSNTVGIYMEGTTSLVVSKNTFNANGWAMRVQSSCLDNTIIQNNYIGNSFDVGTNGTTQLNKFSQNYWDKYEGYDLNKDGIGDVSYHPVSLYSMIIEKMPAATFLLRSFMVSIMDKAERLIPGITPEALKDNEPKMKPLKL